MGLPITRLRYQLDYSVQATADRRLICARLNDTE